MKSIIILFNILFLVILITAPALKKINLIRLLTIVMLAIYSIGIIKLAFLFPVPCLLLLGVGMLAVLCMTFLARHRSIRPEVKGIGHKIQMLHSQQNDIRIKKKGITFKKEWIISENIGLKTFL